MKLLHWIDYICKSLEIIPVLWCSACLLGFLFLRNFIDMPYYSEILMMITAVPSVSTVGDGGTHPSKSNYFFDWGSFLVSFGLILFTGISILGVIIENLL